MDLKERTRQVVHTGRLSDLKKRFSEEGAGCFYVALLSERVRLYPNQLLSRETDGLIISRQRMSVKTFDAITEVGRLGGGLEVTEIVIPCDVQNSEQTLNELSHNGKIPITKIKTKDHNFTCAPEEGAILFFQSDNGGHVVGFNPDGFLGEPGGQEGVEFAQKLEHNFAFLLKLRKC